jgi:hypothetical protein
LSLLSVVLERCQDCITLRDTHRLEHEARRVGTGDADKSMG